ncbi:2828_t:CDS:2 [Ambispora gerdemannii]|uniref:2828_t:CDS:1 n=1 Tax=Ambispora gerdemannii TaxID=144530 RepID=A0A9N9BK47_9GLOM|nr:2828_t:CDS:2 [Ambispora gerdemannii]
MSNIDPTKDTTVQIHANENVLLEKKLDDLYELIDGIKICMMTTRRADGNLTSRPMNTRDRTPAADIWFIGNKQSQNFDELLTDPHVNLAYYNDATHEWVSVSGVAKIVDDCEMIKKLYTPDCKAWFGDLGDGVHDGSASDPRISLIFVEANSVSYSKRDAYPFVQWYRIIKDSITEFALAATIKPTGSSSSSSSTSKGYGNSGSSSSSNNWVFWYYYYNGTGYDRRCANFCILTFSLLAFILFMIILCGCYRCFNIYRRSIKEEKEEIEPPLDSSHISQLPQSDDSSYSQHHPIVTVQPSNHNPNNIPPPPYKASPSDYRPSHTLAETQADSTLTQLPPEDHQQYILAMGGSKAWKLVYNSAPSSVPGQHWPVTMNDNGRIATLHPAKDVNISLLTNYPAFVPSGAVTKDRNRGLMHYFEFTILSNPESAKTKIAIGVATKNYPANRLVGWDRESVGYHSTGQCFHNNPSESGDNYGPEFGKAGDVIGCGYYPVSGIIFFTINGSNYGEVCKNHQVWYPAVSASGPCQVAINFGDPEDEKFLYRAARGFGIGAPYF